jgi:hypothetical protein
VMGHSESKDTEEKNKISIDSEFVKEDMNQLKLMKYVEKTKKWDTVFEVFFFFIFD